MPAAEGLGLLTLLPFLRRFARAVTGSQVAGDAYVEAALATLVAGKSANVPARIALYRSVLAQANAQPTEQVADFTPIGRQAYLLCAMEQFTVQDAALVLQMTEDDVNSLLEDSSADISNQITTDVVIIEDEPLIVMELDFLLQEMGHRVVRVARTEREAVDAVLQTRPGLVLSDIQLADGSSGLDAINQILRDFSVPVIFITAYPERLLTGTKPEPTFLISKPYDRNAVKAVISQALFFERG